MLAKKTPKFYEGVWVGFLDHYGFVVFDPSSTHLYQNEMVRLWVAAEKRAVYLVTKVVREQMRDNLSKVAESDRIRIAREYWLSETGVDHGTEAGRKWLRDSDDFERAHEEYLESERMRPTFKYEKD